MASIASRRSASSPRTKGSVPARSQAIGECQLKAGKFAVSVQWGHGHHYFLSYPDSIHAAMGSRLAVQTRLNEEWEARGRGAKPHVHVWQQVFDD